MAELDRTEPAAPAITPVALDAETAARYLAYSTAFLKAARRGVCDGPPFVRIGRSIRYLRSDLDDWLQSRRVIARRG